MYKLLHPLFFSLDPERAHQLTLQLMRLGGLQPFKGFLQWIYAAPSKPVQAFGLTFMNPVGLAAGYDKDGVAVRGLSALGFGHIEIGTVTPRPQPGNPRPRVFRLVQDEAVINRMGFPGKGAIFVERRLWNFVQTERPTIIGVNLGKNKDTPLEEASEDYTYLVRVFMFRADYLTVNISSPNTVGLRRLQGRRMLENLLGDIANERKIVAENHFGYTPILVKLAPDLSDEELDDALGVILDTGMDGVIATNTTIARPELRSKYREETGGLSGSPLRVASEAMLAKIVRRVDGRIPIVSAGGIMSPEDAKRRLDMGAALVQVYTGLVYRGPGLVREIIRSL